MSTQLLKMQNLQETNEAYEPLNTCSWSAEMPEMEELNLMQDTNKLNPLFHFSASARNGMMIKLMN